MNDPFDLNEYSNDIFELYAARDSSDWLHQADSEEALIRISQHSLDMMGSADADEKNCIRTGISLHEEFKMTYSLIPHQSIEL